ncbi:MAG: hypothetical protein CFK52_11460 [Chloracidobacterium sp. CP2_5A]|nr:MAG: hypothetical protein CFK52_11460 [Chloracidobacterium sp. CP2_5A]
MTLFLCRVRGLRALVRRRQALIELGVSLAATLLGAWAARLETGLARQRPLRAATLASVATGGYFIGVSGIGGRPLKAPVKRSQTVEIR